MPRSMTGEAIEDVSNAMQRAFGSPGDKGWGAVIFYTHVTDDGVFIEGFTYPHPLEPHEMQMMIDNCRGYLDVIEEQNGA